MKNPDLSKEIYPSESELKEIIISFMGTTSDSVNEKVTVEKVIDLFAEQFPELLVVVAEENWINGYTQALNDLEYSNKMLQDTRDTDEKLYKREEQEKD